VDVTVFLPGTLYATNGDLVICERIKFNVRALYYTKNISHLQMHKESLIINRNTLPHVSTLLGHLQRELFVIVILRLHFIVEWECAVNCALEEWNLCGPGPRLRKQRSTQSTAHSHSTIKCNLSVTITKSSPWRQPSRVETCRSVLRLTIKLSLCVCWWLVFLYNIVHGHGNLNIY
jgi:hypothetical protein